MIFLIIFSLQIIATIAAIIYCYKTDKKNTRAFFEQRAEQRRKRGHGFLLGCIYGFFKWVRGKK